MATKIYNVTELQNIDLAGDYELANDIDASGFGFTPLGTFTGTLDGKNFNIIDLTITISAPGGTKRGALININQGAIQNLGLRTCQINITSTDLNVYVGTIAVDNQGIINNCQVSGNIIATGQGTSGWTEAGGISAFNSGIIDKCSSSVIITVTSNRDASAAGIVDWNENGGQIDQSYATGNVSVSSLGSGKKMYAAGLVSDNDGEINNSYARGNATASGGITSNYAGGCIEDNAGTIENGYSTGIPSGALGIGGFCRINSGTVSNCFWDIQTSGTETSSGGIGKTTAEMKERKTFTGWDFATIWSITQFCNDGYPCLQNVTPNCALVPSITGDYVTEIIALEAMRNIEMSCLGRVYVNEEGKLTYESRYARNP